MYHLFVGSSYYPSSGLGDYVGPYEDEDDAVAEGVSRCKPVAEGEEYRYTEDWWVVIAEERGRLTEVRRGYSND